jgi:acyl carrier protein
MTDFSLADINKAIEACIGADEMIEVTPENQDAEFESLGLDSLAFYEVVTVLEETWTVKIGDDALDAIKTPRALVEFLVSVLPATTAV